MRLIPAVHTTMQLTFQTAAGGPLISLSPAFILRKKSQKSFQFACDTAVEQLKEMDDSSVPENMANMFGRLTDSEDENQADDSCISSGSRILFPISL